MTCEKHVCHATCCVGTNNIKILYHKERVCVPIHRIYQKIKIKFYFKKWLLAFTHHTNLRNVFMYNKSNTSCRNKKYSSLDDYIYRFRGLFEDQPNALYHTHVSAICLKVTSTSDCTWILLGFTKKVNYLTVGWFRAHYILWPKLNLNLWRGAYHGTRLYKLARLVNSTQSWTASASFSDIP